MPLAGAKVVLGKPEGSFPYSEGKPMPFLFWVGCISVASIVTFFILADERFLRTKRGKRYDQVGMIVCIVSYCGMIVLTVSPLIRWLHLPWYGAVFLATFLAIIPWAIAAGICLLVLRRLGMVSA